MNSNTQNRKLKLKRSNEIRKVCDFTQEELEDINKVAPDTQVEQEESKEHFEAEKMINKLSLEEATTA